MTLQISTVAASIAGLSFSGVTVATLSTMGKFVPERNCPLLMPVPDNFISNFTVTRDSFGSDAQAKKTARYMLNYRLFYWPVGGDRSSHYSEYAGFVTCVSGILDVLIANSTISGTVDLTPPESFAMGILEEPSGHKFYACDFPIGIMELIN